MTTRIMLIVVALVSATTVLGIAQEVSTPNFQVIDGNAWLIEAFSIVQVYAIDSETNERIDPEPTVSMSYPKDPINMELNPGFYEFVVGMSHLPVEVFYFRFEIIEDGELHIVDLREVDLPEELAIY